MGMVFKTYSSGRNEWDFIKGFRTELINTITTATGSSSNIVETQNSNIDVACAETVAESITPVLELSVLNTYKITFTRTLARTTSSTGSVTSYNVQVTHIPTNTTTGATQMQFVYGSTYGNIVAYRSWKYGVVYDESTLVLFLGNYTQKIINQSPLIQIVLVRDGVKNFYWSKHSTVISGNAKDSGWITMNDNQIVSGSFVDRFSFLHNEQNPSHIAIFNDKAIVDSGGYVISTNKLIDCSNIPNLVGQMLVIKNNKYYALSSNTIIPIVDETG